jgi:Na+-driven multidrug efflux pump
VGLLVIIPGVILLVPAFGIEGAAGATSLAYLAAVAYQWIVFQSRTQTKFRDLFLNHEDLKFIRLMLQKVKRKRT